MKERSCENCRKEIIRIWNDTLDYEAFAWQVMEFIGWEAKK